MAEQRLHVITVLTGAVALVLGTLLALRATTPAAGIVGLAGALALAQMLTVPAPSGERIHLGIGVGVAAALLLSADRVGLGAAYALGLGGAWIGYLARGEERVLLGTRFVSEAAALAAFGGVFHYTGYLLERAGTAGAWEDMIAIGAGGLVWYVVRAMVRALLGFERTDLSPRYLWLLALDDWSTVLSLFGAGALFGFTYPVMGLWAVPVSLMPYGFTHLAFVRYNDTRLTYRQTIRSLSRIPEVGALSPDGHSVRTTDLALAMARDLGLRPDEVTELEYAALMHDIGRVTLNEPAILKAGYTDEDIARWGAQIIAEAPYLAEVAAVVREQHRPYRRPGEQRDPELKQASKIIKVASSFDVAVTEQVLSPLEAIERLHLGAAYEFDPEVVASLRRVLVHRRALIA